MNKTRKSLLTSALSLLLCCAMLVGTTLAWFTDSVTSSNNKIQSGTLNVDLELLDKEAGTWNSIKDSQEAVFNYNNWEPGYAEVKVLKVQNEGTLALKWYASIVAQDGEVTDLADVIDVYVKEGVNETDYPSSREEVKQWKHAGTVADFIAYVEDTTTGELKAGEEETLAIALVMQETAGNEYQGMSIVEDASGNAGTLDIRISVAQDMVEEDSFDETYDEDAKYHIFPAVVGTSADLSEVLAEGTGYALMSSDIAVDGTVTMSGGVLDGDGYILTNNNRITLLDPDGGTIKNLNVECSTVKLGRKEYYVEKAVGQMTNTLLTEDLYIENVDISNAYYSVSINANGHNIYFKDCELANNIEICNQGEVVFENCHFYTDSACSLGTSWLRLSGSMTFINCHFEETVDFYAEAAGTYSGTLKFTDCTYGNNGVEDRPFEKSVTFFTYWMEVSGVTGYQGAFGEGDAGRVDFTCIVDDTVVW